MKSRTTLVVLVALVFVGLVASGCSSSSHSASTTASTSASGSTQAPSLAQLEKQVTTLEAPPKFPFTVPLQSKPATGKTVYFLEGSGLSE